MEDGKQLWSIWQRLLACFTGVFTRPGWVRFAQWLSGMVLCPEEHTITQEVTSLGMTEQWRNFEHFAEYGAFNQRAVEQATMNIIEREHPCRFGRYHPAAVDDTKELRASPHVWGTCTFKHVSSRNPKHPKLVMAHNWVIMGDLAPGGKDQPWTYLPTASRLYLRAAQLPPGEMFRTKNDMAVEMLRQSNASSAAPVLGIFDGGYARANVVQPCLHDTSRRIEVLTRPRSDARLYQPLPSQQTTRGKPKRGRPRKWGQRLPAPRDCRRWKGVWRKGRAYAYGQPRRFRYKVMDCRWSVSGPDMPVRIFAFKVEGYQETWCIITSALDLSAAQVLEAYAARFRQEDAIRDHKQRLGMEEVRAWTKAPVLRTFQVQLLSMTLLRLMQWELDKCWGNGWCSPPPWNPHKTRVSILDLRRLLWKHREEYSQFLQEMDEVKKPKPAA
jgi:hypothetical protein